MSKEITIKKIRNGCWRVYVGSKKISEHSMYAGAEKVAEQLRKNNATFGDE
jgi:predicted Rossmann-fold nucleotide-binding protein